MFGSGTTGNSSPGSKAAAAETTDDAAAAKIPLSSPTTGSDGVDEGASTTPASAAAATPSKTTDQAASGEKRSGNGSPTGRNSNNGSDNGGGGGAGVSSDKKRRSSSSVGGKASSLIASAKNSLNFAHVGRASAAAAAANANSSDSQSPIQKLGRHDPALAVPQGQYNNSAGESLPGPKSTFRVGVWEDRNKKCRRTMEDTHAFLYNFLSTTPPPRPATTAAAVSASDPDDTVGSQKQDVVESDNGYFAIFDGHAGTFAADWCGKKLHVLLEDTVRRNPTAPMPELLDQTFTAVDSQLEKLPVKNSGCTAAIAVLRWEDRVPSDRSVTGSQPLSAAAAAAAAAKSKADEGDGSKPQKTDSGGSKGSSSSNNSKGSGSKSEDASASAAATARLKREASRQRVLYTANVGDARIVLCRSGKALRLSYDHKGSDENEGRRIANAGGLILNNRVNGVLAVTRALGDTYMKDLVTGHPYTTETVIQPGSDEFVIIACDGIWDVCSDQEAVDLVRDMHDPVAASKLLVDHALSRFSTDNLSCMVVRMDREAGSQGSKSVKEAGAEKEDEGEEDEGEEEEGEEEEEEGTEAAAAAATAAKVSEVDKIVGDVKRKIAEDATAAVGVSPSNSGRGHDPIARGRGRDDADAAASATTQSQSNPPVASSIEGAVLEEEPSAISEEDEEGQASPSDDKAKIDDVKVEGGEEEKRKKMMK